MSQAFDDLIQVMQRLLAPDGCPWDLNQSNKTLIPYLIEEAYEVIDAIERESAADLKEELGDLLLQVVFHAALQSKKNAFTIEDVARGITDKLIRRHPHVFGGAECRSAEDVSKQWDQIKAEEKKGRSEGYLDSVPKSLPALAEAQKISKKAAKTGFDWENAAQVIDKISEEVAEIQEALKRGDKENQEEEIGDLFFALVNWCRHQKIDPEIALKRSNKKFRTRFTLMQSLIALDQQAMRDLSPPQWDTYWNAAKEKLR